VREGEGREERGRWISSHGSVADPLSHILLMLHLMHGDLNENRKVSFLLL
jgi:hypothetical protein